ncbi:hypothetical protein [Pseudarthrobacter equi]|nr:hypothetical protein [Pseudarthrobacter equi]
MTLGSLWLLLARKTRMWMIGGTLSVLAGTALGGLSLTRFLGSGQSEPRILLPSLALSLGGGYAVLFPGLGTGCQGVRIRRDWRRHPMTGRVLWVLSLAVATAGLATCIVAGMVSPLAPGQLVWIFMGIYLALAGWASAIMGAAASLRQDTAGTPASAEEEVTVPGL